MLRIATGLGLLEADSIHLRGENIDPVTAKRASDKDTNALYCREGLCVSKAVVSNTLVWVTSSTMA